MKKTIQFVQALAVGAIILALTMIGIQSINASEVSNFTEPSGTKTLEVNEAYYDLTPKVRLTIIFHDKDLRVLQIRNGGERVIVSLFNKEYQIGKNDVITIDPPNVPAFVLELRPYMTSTAHDALYAKAHYRTFHVKMPAQKNNTVSSAIYHKRITPPKT